MKGKLSSIWRLATALMLTLSLSLVMATPASAATGVTSYADPTTSGQRIKPLSAPTALLKISVTGTGGAEVLQRVKVQFTNVSGFDKTDLLGSGDQTGLMLYKDGGNGTFESGTDTLKTPTSVSWDGLLAQMNFTETVAADASIYFVVIKTSDTIADGDAFTAKMGLEYVMIDAVWYGAAEEVTYTITGDTQDPTVTAANIVGTTIQSGNDKVVITFSESVKPKDGTWGGDDKEFTIKTGAVGTAYADLSAITLTNAVFSPADGSATTTLTIYLATADENANLLNGNIVAIKPAGGAQAIQDLALREMATAEIVGTTLITGDTTAPAIAASQIIGTTVSGGNDTIKIGFSEAVKPSDNTWGPADDEFVIKRGTTTLDLTNASFSLSGATLTITLSENVLNSATYLVNGQTLYVTPQTGGVKDLAGTDLPVTQVASVAPVTGDVDAPTFSIAYYTDSTLETGLDLDAMKVGTYYIKVTANEALTATPTVNIAAEGTANDVTAGATTAFTGMTVFKYTRTITSDAAAVGTTAEAIQITGTDLAGNIATNADVANEKKTDTVAPTISSALGTVVTGADNDNIKITFSEAVGAVDGNWNGGATTEVSSIESPVGTALNLTSATYSYADGVLTVTLKETNAVLVAGNTLKVTLAGSAIRDISARNLLTATIKTADRTVIGAGMPTITGIVGNTVSGINNDTIVITFSEAPTAVDGVWNANEFSSIESPVGTALTLPTDNANYSLNGSVLTITLGATSGNYLVNGDLVAVTPAAGKIWDADKNLVVAEKVTSAAAASGDGDAPTMPEANIVGTAMNNVADKIEITFSEAVRPSDGTWSANEFTSIESPVGTTLSLTGASFSYAAASAKLTITLDDSNAHLLNASFVKVTPALNAVRDLAGTALAITAVTSNADVVDDATGPTFTTAIAYYSDSALNSPLTGDYMKAGTYYIKITASERLGAAPTVTIDAEGTANDVTAGTTTLDSTKLVATYTRVIRYDPAAEGKVAEVITVTGSDENSNATTNYAVTGEKWTDTVVPTTVTLNSPNGGESWTQDQVKSITWSATDGRTLSALLVISLRYYNGTTWSTITGFDGINDGVYNWTVPSISSSNVLVEVTATDDAGNSSLDASNNVFTIAAAVPAATSTINLSTGWNLVSFPLILTPTPAAFVGAITGGSLNTTGGISGNFTLPNSWQNYVGTEFDNLTSMQDGKGYFVKWTGSGSVDVAAAPLNGVALPTPPNAPPTYALSTGWNLIGFKSTTTKTASSYLTGVSGITTIYRFDAVAQAYVTVTGSDNMTPGNGYWLAVTQTGTIYP